MFKKIIEFMFPEPKTDLQLAVDKILDQTIVSNHSILDTDPVNGSYFAVGKIKYTYSGFGTDNMGILFSGDKNDVVIKYNGDVIYYFNSPSEVEVIRTAIITCFNNMQLKKAQENKKDFGNL